MLDRKTLDLTNELLLDGALRPGDIEQAHNHGIRDYGAGFQHGRPATGCMQASELAWVPA
jgi:hypothetical protein